MSFTILYFSLYTPLPSKKSPCRLYSNQKNDHLGYVTKKAVKNARDSIHIHTYSLSDKSLIHLLKEKTKKGCSLKIYTDKKTSKSERNKNPTLHWDVKSGSGLMHEKILVIDGKTTYLGTANLSYESLNRHDNMIVGIYSEELSSHIIDHYQNRLNKVKTTHKSFNINNQEIDLWFLPDTENKALLALIQEISKAKSKIQIAIYTLTHKGVIEALIEAKRRGVVTEVYVDQSSAFGPSKKACAYLKSNNIYYFTSPKQKLLHYKMMLIDNKNLIIGSSNWTKSAFNKNQDFFIIMKNLNKKQIKSFKRVFHNIKKESFSSKK